MTLPTAVASGLAIPCRLLDQPALGMRVSELETNLMGPLILRQAHQLPYDLV